MPLRLPQLSQNNVKDGSYFGSILRPMLAPTPIIKVARPSEKSNPLTLPCQETTKAHHNYNGGEQRHFISLPPCLFALLICILAGSAGVAIRIV